MGAKGKGKGKGKGGACFQCGDTSHQIKDCPHRVPKGKGKGKSQEAPKGGGEGGYTKGLGKGYDQGGPKGGDGGNKGGGKGFQRRWNNNPLPPGNGYQGVCDRCGEVGHKWRECQKPWVQEMQAEGVEDEGGGDR